MEKKLVEMREAIREAIDEEMARDDGSSVVAMRSRLARARESFRRILVHRMPSLVDESAGDSRNV